MGLVLAGNADFKTELSKRLDRRLSSVLLGVVDIQYNGLAGFHEALDKAEPFLQGLAYYEEKRDLAEFMERIRTTAPVTFGPYEAVRVLVESGGAVERLLLWSDLPLLRRSLKKTGGDETKWDVRHPDEEKKIPEGWELLEETPLLAWLMEHCKEFGAEISLITGQSPSGSQFVAGFGGVGALLRYSFDLAEEAMDDDAKKKKGKESDEEDSFEW